jgi:8-amino-3,8-dideoxy-alpha-D-manno-octulosonate transaminase
MAEVDQSLTIDAADAERKITPYTRAIIPVHMRGSVCDMDAIMAVAGRHDLKVLEDVAQANGGAFRGRPLGSIGQAGAFSLQHFKIITAGEGGVLVTDDAEVYRRAAIKHDSAMQFWRDDADWPSFAGENYRMCELRAALGLAQFERMAGILQQTRRIKQRLIDLTADLPAIEQQTLHDAAGDCGVAFAFFLGTADLARRFAEALNAEGVPAGTIYNKQIPDRHIYHAWDYVLDKRTSDHTGWPWSAAHREVRYSPDMCPQTLDVLGRCITIGLNQHWTDEHAELVAEAIRKVHDALCR